MDNLRQRAEEAIKRTQQETTGVYICKSAEDWSADVPDFAAAILRLTGPEMRERIRRCVWACPTEGDLVSTIMDMILLLAEVQ